MSTDSIRDSILDAAVDVLRRHGPAKAGVVDVARALDMSHSNVYKYFASKSALFDAVAERWLANVMAPLSKIAADKKTPAPRRLKAWLRTLAETKRQKVLEDPELFAVYRSITENAHAVVAAHVARLHDEIADILRDGVREGVWRVSDVDKSAEIILSASSRFHHPAMVALDEAKTDLKQLDALTDLLIAGMKS